jgi:hypothetical protein
LSAEIKDEIKMEYGLLERANLLSKALEEIFSSSNDKRSSSTSIPENISSSYIHINQDQEEKSSIQKEEVNPTNLRKPDGPVSQTRTSNFGRIETSLDEEDDCSTSSSDVDDEYDDQELLLEFKKLISKHMKLQERYEDLLCSHKKFMDSYVLLESTHEVMLIMVKSSQPYTCTCAPL